MALRLSRRVIALHIAGRLLKADDTVLAELAAFLIDTRRTGEVELIVRDIEHALAEAGVVLADVAAARELTSTLQKSIVAYITSEQGATEVHLRTSVDETLLGGVRISVPGAERDMTLRRQLTKLQALKV
jgi:F-type H+-transporting ATPase subunit delta